MTILGRSEELASRCVECDLAEPESLASLGGSAPGVVDGILSLELWGTDINNAYLKAHTKEKLFIVAGPEYDDLEGHIDKAL